MLNFLCRKRYAITNKVWIRSPSCSPSYPGGRKALLLVWPLLWQWRVMKLCVCNKKRPQELLWLAPRWKKNKKRLPLLLGGVYFVVIIIRFSHFAPTLSLPIPPTPMQAVVRESKSRWVVPFGGARTSADEGTRWAYAVLVPVQSDKGDDESHFSVSRH